MCSSDLSCVRRWTTSTSNVVMGAPWSADATPPTSMNSTPFSISTLRMSINRMSGVCVTDCGNGVDCALKGLKTLCGGKRKHPSDEGQVHSRCGMSRLIFGTIRMRIHASIILETAIGCRRPILWHAQQGRTGWWIQRHRKLYVVGFLARSLKRYSYFARKDAI